jgi:CBS domain-containing protein
MEKVTAILDKKQTHFNKISPDCSISEALYRMSGQKNMEYLIVVDDDEKFLGLLTEHDVARKTLLSRLPIENTSVQSIMNTRLPFADVEDTVEHCMRLMKRYNTRYLPVFDGFRFRGIISGDDILEEAVYSRAGIFDEVEEAAPAFY